MAVCSFLQPLETRVDVTRLTLGHSIHIVVRPATERQRETWDNLRRLGALTRPKRRDLRCCADLETCDSLVLEHPDRAGIVCPGKVSHDHHVPRG